MKNNHVVSSAQALDDYFDALLLDDDLSHSQHIDNKEHLVVDLSVSEFVLIPQPVSYVVPDVFTATLTKEQRDFTSVEKLLRHLKLDDACEVKEKEVTQTQVDVIVYPQINAESDFRVKLYMQTDQEVITECDPLDLIEVCVEEKIIPCVKEIHEDEYDLNVEVDTSLEQQSALQWKNISPENAFQVLFFESFGVTYAVPLSQLGGIHRLGSCNYLLGRPDWYLGLQVEGHKQIDVVDTAKWVMPEKIADNCHRDDYNYIVLLGGTPWALACNSLLGTELLKVDQIRWREEAGKRPWLAGLVKEKMCALIHVEAFVAMLNQGINAKTLA